ncbi:hypothetical protein [uncultured Maribacter sp.]|uniref:hypothetical protein n=1 Tax=uncultured Maribacter sp. TaxID=431308 RepID=UPI002619E643|nr:hypothetical protein [uncultured Maribacter sp.]
MRLTYTCRVCKQQNYLPIKEETRPDLQKKVNADEVRVNCKNCGKDDKRHISRITAIPDNRIILVGVIMGVILTFVLIQYLGLIASITFSTPIFVWKYESEQAHKFNSYALRRK